MKFISKINEGECWRYGIDLDVEHIRNFKINFWEFFILVNFGHKRLWFGLTTNNKYPNKYGLQNK